jgi:hypothetical protein
MRIVRDVTRHLLLCAVGALLTVSVAGAQTGAPDVPTGPGPTCLAPAPVEPSTSGPPAVFAPWSGFAPSLQIQQAWPFLSVVPLTPRFHPVVMREPRGWTLGVSRAAAGRLIRR